MHRIAQNIWAISSSVLSSAGSTSRTAMPPFVRRLHSRATSASAASRTPASSTTGPVNPSRYARSRSCTAVPRSSNATSTTRSDCPSAVSLVAAWPRPLSRNSKRGCAPLWAGVSSWHCHDLAVRGWPPTRSSGVSCACIGAARHSRQPKRASERERTPVTINAVTLAGDRHQAPSCGGDARLGGEQRDEVAERLDPMTSRIELHVTERAPRSRRDTP